MGRIRQAMDNAASSTKKTIARVKEKYTFLNDLGIGFWLLICFMFLVGLFSIVYIESIISILVSDYGYIGIFVTSIFTELIVQPVGPDVPLALGVMSGVMHPFVVLICVLLGSYIALIMAYYLGASIGAAGIERIMGKKAYSKIDKYALQGKWFMFIGALTPIPYVPYFAGLWKFNLKDTLIFVVLPRTMRFVGVFLLLYFLGIRFI